MVEDDFDDDVQDALVPDLDLGGSGSSKAAVSESRPRARPETGGGASTMFDDDDDAFGGAPLELDVQPTHAKPSQTQRAASLAPSEPPPPRSLKAVRPDASLRPKPAGNMEPRSGGPPKEEIEARVLGDFGEVPTAFWRTPSYAWRVRKRLIQLRVGLDLRKRDAASANATLEKALVALGQRARPAAQGNAAHSRALSTIAAAEALMRSRDGALASEMDAHAKKVAGLEERKRSLDAELSAAQTAERKCAEELSAAQASLQRAEAKVKSTDIEIRNASTSRDPRRGGT